jgi:GTP cyclohydrolase II
MKIAIDAVWNIPGVCARLKMPEPEVRQALYKYTGDPKLLDTNLKAYLPQIGGTTVYVFGEIDKLTDLSTEVAVRVHDECNGSDVFGTDICTCRPYLMYAVEGAVQCAQRGGVGIVIYYRKEGRALGEVTKFRVYNARKRQEGGDRAATYFAQTESIAGIRDARFQDLMPDPILWLGIRRIDKLLSMSSEKYDAIINAGIEVMQRVALPENWVPENALVEISAKIHAGYHSNGIEMDDGTLNSLLRLEAVRERCSKIYDLAVKGETKYLSFDQTLIPKAADFVSEVILKHYPKLDIPYHSRWRHFEALNPKTIENLKASWKCNDKEKVRRLLDLAVVSVLLDAGAGPSWKYTDEDGNIVTRSEGLALASLDMFKSGAFSSDAAAPHRLNSLGIKKLSFDDFKHALQHSKNNPLAAIEERYKLFQKLAVALDEHPEYFGHEVARPGNLLDFVLERSKDNHVSLSTIWEAISNGLVNIWPSDAPKVKKGDMWHYQPLKEKGVPGSDLVPFHKISQWLTYSLIEPLESLGLVVDDLNKLTALAEYRNGGLLVDLGVLKPKADVLALNEFDVGTELIVEWRALTVTIMDQIAAAVRQKLNKTEKELNMAQILQGGTWQAGREIARTLRADGRPPIQIRLNGVTF